MKLSVLVPEATINYIKNPSLRYDTTDWNANGATLTRTLARARFGIASLQVVTAGSAVNEGASFRVSALSGISEPVTVSAYVRGEGIVRIRLDNNVVGGAEYPSQGVTLQADRWTRISVSGYSTGGNDLRLYVETAESLPKARTFYVDGAQMERKAYPTTYCDGDQPGCRWSGIFHASTSSRDVNTRAGGAWMQLAGAEREAQDLYATVVSGLGVAPLANHTQPYALQPGSFFQNSRIEARPIAMAFHAKHTVDDEDLPVSLSALHELRQTLIDLVKPDRTGGDEDIWFEYVDGDVPLYFQARYDGGLEGDWDIRNQFINSFTLKLIAVSPLLLEDTQDAQLLDFQDSTSINTVAARLDGVWNNMNYGINYWVAHSGLIFGPRGQIYAIGYDNNMTTVNNNAAAVDPLRAARALIYWDGEKWVPLGTVTNMGGNGILSGIAVHPNGDVYVIGDFTSIGGVAASHIARWDGTTWNALGAGLNASGNAVIVAPNGDVYAGGTFTSAGGVVCYRVARWDGGSWHQLGPYRGLDGPVHALEISLDGSTLYLGGTFTDQQGIALSSLLRVAQYNVAAATFAAMGAGFGGLVEKLRLSPSNTLYAGGTFTTSGTASVLGIAYWNGSTWNSLGSSILAGENAGTYIQIDRVADMAFFQDGNILAVGSFSPSTLSINRLNMALWNGSVWARLDAEIDFVNLNQIVYSCLVSPKDDIYIGLWGGDGTTRVMRHSGITSVTNYGSTIVKPRFYLKGPGRLEWIENQTTKARMYFNMTLQNNEEVFIDIAKGTIASVVRGSLLYTMAAGSDFHSFTLVPGDNKIACLLVNDVGAIVQIYHQPSHWSVDATSGGQS